MKRNLEVPEEFILAPFYKKGDIFTYDSNMTVEDAGMFVFEITVTKGIALYKPWAEKEISIPIVLQLWIKDKERIASLFRERKRGEAKMPMIIHAARFLSVLFWLNDAYISSLKQWNILLKNLSVKPVNIEERFNFIRNQPDHYHSFIQLTQLYEEAEKLFEKRIVMQKSHLPE